MTGTLIERSEGSWSIVVYLGAILSRGRNEKWSTFRGNKKQAQAELLVLCTSSTPAPTSSRPNLRLPNIWSAGWTTTPKPTWPARHLSAIAKIVRKQLTPALGSILLSNLKPLHIQGFYSAALQTGRRRKGDDGEARGLSAQTVLHLHRVLREALSRAVKWQLLIRNPADAVEPPKPARNEMRALSEA